MRVKEEAIVLTSVVGESLTEKVTSDKDIKEIQDTAMQISEEQAFQVEGVACGKCPREI